MQTCIPVFCVLHVWDCKGTKGYEMDPFACDAKQTAGIVLLVLFMSKPALPKVNRLTALLLSSGTIH